MQPLTKPKLPREFYRPSAWGSAAFCAYAVAMLSTGIFTSTHVYAADWPSWAKLAALLPAYVLAGQGLHLLGWIGHEGFHFNLAQNKYLSAALGIAFSGPIAGFSTVGENSVHWDHHRFTNRRGDAQTVVFPKHKTFLRRLLLARLELEHLYLRNAIRLARGDLQIAAAFPPPTMRRLARIDLLYSALWLALYAYLLWRDPTLGVLAIVLPHASAFAMSALRPYIEHAGTGADEFHQARTARSPWLSALYFFNNYHLEHHLYPSVPCWRLPRVHRLLVERGVYAAAQPHITHGLWAAQRCAGAAFAYPEPSHAQPEIAAHAARTGFR